MRLKKRICSLILAIVICITALPVAYAADNTKAADDKIVANFYVYVMETDIHPIGHMWVYLENLTDKPITVGRYTVAPYDDVSVGCFGTEGPRGGGVYYNLEQDLTHYHSLKATSTDLTEAELQAVTNKIKNYSHWDPILNCYYFAAMGWNAGAESSIPFLVFPTFARLYIQMRGGISKPFDLFSQNDPVYRQNEL